MSLGQASEKKPPNVPTLYQHPFPGVVPDLETATRMTHALALTLLGAKQLSKMQIGGRLEGDTWKMVVVDDKKNSLQEEPHSGGYYLFDISRSNAKTQIIVGS